MIYDFTCGHIGSFKTVVRDPKPFFFLLLFFITEQLLSLLLSPCPYNQVAHGMVTNLIIGMREHQSQLVA